MSADRVGILHGPQWHNERRIQLFEAHPDARKLVGRNLWSAPLVCALVAVQFAVAVTMRAQPVWVVLLVAYLMGAFISHALGVLIHEFTHDLVFRRPWLNRLFSIVANVPLVFPAAIDFRDKHLAHHAHLGEPDGPDTQAPQAWEFGFVRSRLRAFIWHSFGPLMVHRAQRSKASGWLPLNFVLQGAVVVPFAVHYGWRSMLFLLASAWLAFGPHPIGIRRYGEHLTLALTQPTTSYYGLLNWLSLNVGFHVEHHDLPSVPWNRLPKLRALAPELYTPLKSISSWSFLLWGLLTRDGEGPNRYYLERPSRGTADSSDDHSAMSPTA